LVAPFFCPAAKIAWASFSPSRAAFLLPRWIIWFFQEANETTGDDPFVFSLACSLSKLSTQPDFLICPRWILRGPFCVFAPGRAGPLLSQQGFPNETFYPMSAALDPPSVRNYLFRRRDGQSTSGKKPHNHSQRPPAAFVNLQVPLLGALVPPEMPSFFALLRPQAKPRAPTKSHPVHLEKTAPSIGTPRAGQTAGRSQSSSRLPSVFT